MGGGGTQPGGLAGGGGPEVIGRTPPADYNENETVYNGQPGIDGGGAAEIQRVQGGGAEEESQPPELLLVGGALPNPLAAIKSGAAKLAGKKAKPLSSTPSGPAAAAATPKATPTKNPAFTMFEYYKLSQAEIAKTGDPVVVAIEAEKEAGDKIKNATAILEISELEKKWAIYHPDVNNTRASLAPAPTFATCPSAGQALDKKAIPGYRRIQILPTATIKTVVVVPPVRGDRMRLYAVLTMLKKMNLFDETSLKIKEDVAVVCSAPFFKLPDMDTLAADTASTIRTDNLELFKVYLALKEKNKVTNNFFALPEFTIASFFTDLLLSSYCDPSSSAAPANRDNEKLLFHMEPSHIVFPAQDRTIILTGATTGEPALAPSNSPHAQNIEQILPFWLKQKYDPKSTTKDPVVQELFEVGRSLAYYPIPGRENVALKNCLRVRGIAEDDAKKADLPFPKKAFANTSSTFCRDFYVGSLRAQEVFLGIGGVSKDILFEYDYADPAVTVEPRPRAMICLLIRSGINPRKYLPLCQKPPEKRTPMKVVDGYEASDEAKDTESHTAVDIIMPDKLVKVFLIRQATPDVVEDWRNERFTQQEADYLNAMRLRKYIVKDVVEYMKRQNIYPVDFSDGTDVTSWISAKRGDDTTIKNYAALKTDGDYIAQFLKSLSQSKCFTDLRIMTRYECNYVRQFIDAIYWWYEQNDRLISGLDVSERLKLLDEQSGYEASLQRFAALERKGGELTEEQRKKTVTEFTAAFDKDVVGDKIQAAKDSEFDDGGDWGKYRPREDTLLAIPDKERTWETPLLAIQKGTGAYKFVKIVVKTPFKADPAASEKILQEDPELQAIQLTEKEFDKVKRENPGWIFIF